MHIIVIEMTNRMKIHTLPKRIRVKICVDISKETIALSVESKFNIKKNM